MSSARFAFGVNAVVATGAFTRGGSWRGVAVGALLAIACRGAATEPPAPKPLVDASPSAPIVAIEDAAPSAPSVVDAAVRVKPYRACLEAHYVVPPSVPDDDGKTKTMAERIVHPDIEDVFAVPYETGPIAPVVDPEHDPGRVRLEAVFDATYGASAEAISKALVPVTIAGTTLSFHEKAAPALARVAKRLEPLVAKPALRRFFAKMGGTFAYREIAGPEHLRSAHSWAIAIDLDPAACEYWRNGPQPPVWKNRVPREIVDAFEAEGFVWGGRWFHYDTMHFEYRPELFDPRCAAGR